MSARHTLTGMVAAATLIAGSASAEPVVWTMGYVNATGSAYLEAIKTMPERISKATDGQVKIELNPNLVKGPQQPAGLRDGRLDIIAGVNPWLSGEAPILNIGHLPGLIKNPAEYKKVLDAGLDEDIAKVWLEKYNGIMLSHGVFERQVILSNKPILKASDFKGLKVRVHNTEAAQLMNQLGAKPTPVAFGEIAPALQRGVVDAVMTSTGTSFGFGFYSVADYIHYWGIGTGVGWSVVVNKESWQKLSSDLQKKVRAEFKAIEDDHYAGIEAYSDEMTQKQIDKGMTLIAVGSDERAEVFKPGNVQAVYDAWYKLCEERGYDGRALVAKAHKLLGH
ncbi:MAG TPA: TRAP transporter substrate-binding protein DctP [Woeseiaceae bacterium]|nr:TRAP transporter substrate-binding protein DctP [Woeseiaceae bacterium]